MDTDGRGFSYLKRNLINLATQNLEGEYLLVNKYVYQ